MSEEADKKRFMFLENVENIFIIKGFTQSMIFPRVTLNEILK